MSDYDEYPRPNKNGYHSDDSGDVTCGTCGHVRPKRYWVIPIRISKIRWEDGVPQDTDYKVTVKAVVCSDCYRKNQWKTSYDFEDKDD